MCTVVLPPDVNAIAVKCIAISDTSQFLFNPGTDCVSEDAVQQTCVQICKGQLWAMTVLRY